MSKDNLRLGGGLAKSGNLFLGIGVLGAVLCAVSFFQDRKAFLSSYLTAFVFFLAISLGALFFVMVQHVARSGWSVTIRRIPENLAANLPWMGLLFLPVFAGMGYLLPWLSPEARAHDVLIQAKAGYLNLPFLIIRTVVYFVAWAWISRYFLNSSVRQDQTSDMDLTARRTKWAHLGLAVYGVTETFFAFDWIMSLNPHWFSTMFGVYFFAGQVVAQYCSIIIIAWILLKTGHAKGYFNVEHFHDLGKLLFGHNVFWAYIGYGQFMLIWYASMPEETVFFHARAVAGWKAVSLSLPWLHFALPFLFLMSRNIKRRVPLMAIGCAWLLVMCYVDIYWLVQPNFHPQGPVFGLGDIASIAAVGGLFLGLFLNRLRKYNLVPVGDPRLQMALHYDNA